MNDQDIEILKFEDKTREKKHILFYSFLLWCVVFGWGMYFYEIFINSKYPFVSVDYPYYSLYDVKYFFYALIICCIIFSIVWIKILNDFDLKLKNFIFNYYFFWSIFQNSVSLIHKLYLMGHKFFFNALNVIFFMSASFCLWVRDLAKISEKKLLKYILINSEC